MYVRTCVCMSGHVSVFHMCCMYIMCLCAGVCALRCAQGPEEEELRRLAESLGIDDRVEFLGHLSREELLEEYKKSLALVLPTREDCFALVILEAMCSGLPIVCSKYADGAFDLIADGRTGYIVDPFDETAFALRLDRMLRDPKEAWQMGEDGRKRTEKFHFSCAAKGFMEAVYLALQ